MNLPTPGDSSLKPASLHPDPKDSLRAGELQKTITMAQIAKAAGVSQGAISSLLNDRDYGIRVSDKTRERVFKVCREMGYVPNDLRAVVRMYPELGDFCLLASTRPDVGLSDSSLARVAASALRAAEAKRCGFSIGFYQADTDYSTTPEHLPHGVAAGVASKFILLGAPNPSLVAAIFKRGYPLVTLGHSVNIPGVFSILADYQLAARSVIEHLANLGHRRIAIVSGPSGSNLPLIVELNRGINLACEALGMELPAENILYGDLSFEAGVAAFESISSSQNTPTAVFCLSDAAAAGLMAKALSCGVRVPEHLSVVGCGDDAVAQTSLPGLTTAHIPLEEMATEAVHCIDGLVRGPMPETPQLRLYSPNLNRRGSTGPVR